MAAPNGLGTRGLLGGDAGGGKTGIGRISRFDPAGYPARLAGEVAGFEAAEHLPSRLLPQTDRMTRLALVAADWALADAGIEPDELAEFDMGVVTASSSGGFEFGQSELRKLWSKGAGTSAPTSPSPGSTRSTPARSPSGTGLKGPSGVVVTDQAGGLDAVAQARRQVRKGTRLMVTGGGRRLDLPVGLGGAAGQRAASAPATTRTAPTCRSTAAPPGTCRARAARSSSWRSAESARRRGRPQSTARSPATARPSTRGRAAAANRGCARRSSWRWPTPA